MKELKLTNAEVAHLYLLLQYNETEGIYWGNGEHWWKQHKSIKEKIRELASVKKRAKTPKSGSENCQ